MPEQRRNLVRLIGFFTLIIALIVVMRFFGIGQKLGELRIWIKDLGFLGPFVFAAIFAVTTVLAIPGSVMSVAAGAMFGPVIGTIAVSVGSTTGAGLAFLIARYLARGSVQNWVNKQEKFKRLDELFEKKGAIIVAITRLIPLFPFTLLNYGFGLTRIKFFTYLFWSWLCMLPGTILYVSGSDIIFKLIAHGKIPWAVIGIFVVSAVLLFFLIRNANKNLKENRSGGKTLKVDYHMIVIGAGSAGLSVAAGCAAFGARVALIENKKMGGECLHTGCVPSKTFLKSAHLANQINRSSEFGLEARLQSADIRKIMERVRSVIDEIAPHDSKERFTSLGVDVFKEEASFIDNHTVKAGDRILTGKKIVIATGSIPLIPPIPGLKDVPFYTNENIFEIDKLPKHLIVLGGGPVGIELSQGFRYLGSEVTVIDMLPHLFPKDDQEVAPLLEKKLIQDGMILQLSSKILEVKSSGDAITVVLERKGIRKEISGDALLVALGRSPYIGSLKIENAGVKTDKRGYIATGPDMRTNISNIFACGDITGNYQFTHGAGYQAGIVVQNSILPLKAKTDYSFFTWVTYTNPMVAHAGYTEQSAKSLGLFQKSKIVPLSESDRAKTDGDQVGFIKFVLGRRNRLLGVTIVSSKADEMIGMAALAIARKMSGTGFSNIIFSYPTESELYKSVSFSLLRDSLKPWMKNLVRKIFLK